MLYRTSIRAFARGALIALVLVASASRSAAAQAQPSAGDELGASSLPLRDSIVALARAQIGRRYRHGGASPKRGFDCSGLVEFVYSNVNLALPRTALQQASFGVALERDTSELRPGDLLTFATRERGRISHIGIYVGGGHFVHASSVAGHVIESPVYRPSAPRIKIWNGVRRIPLAGERGETPPDAVVAPER